MLDGIQQRASQCFACGKPAAGEGPRCIFCGASLLVETVSHWRSVYHPRSQGDALLADATLKAHGLVARLRQSNIERVLLGHVGCVIEVAEGDHLIAQEVLRQLRGIRTDTEFLEWQHLKSQKGRGRRILIGLLAVATATAAMAVGILWKLSEEVPATESMQKQAQP